ncbi:MAG TPA: hypothetical protein VFD59_20540 [Nocardioidaceae bacterium]|nr:hypothetical protein [Nocardioidaceae bacterium]
MSRHVIRVRYHHEPDGWWAESSDLDGFVAAGASLDEVRGLVQEGVPFYLETDDFEIQEVGETDSRVRSGA